MPFQPVQRLISFFLPAGGVFLLAVLLSRDPAMLATLQPVADIYYYSSLLVALVLGWRFDRSLLFFSAAIIGFAYWLLQHFGMRGDAIGRIVTDAVALLLPLNLLLLILLKERGIFTLHGLSRWGIILIQPLLIWMLLHYQRYDWLGILDYSFIHNNWIDDLQLHQPALLAYISALAACGYRILNHRGPVEITLLWLIALLAYAQLQGPTSTVTTLLIGTALLMLIIAVLEVSYGMAFRDELTGLAGRRALNQTLPKLGNRYTIAMLDVDHFKRFNDTYGHDIGDEVLKMVAKMMGRVSGGGKAYRYGGEEFTVIFPGKDIEYAKPHLEALREAIASNRFMVRDKKRPRKKPQNRQQSRAKAVQITVSIGIAERQEGQRSPESVIKAADKALYKAKKAGRNRLAW